MEIALVSATAALASLLTFFTGFGLATILTPVMLLFFPAPVAIALTALVHLINNLFKYVLLRTHIDWRTVARFGVPAGIGAVIGAALLSQIPQQTSLAVYTFASKTFYVTPLRLVIGSLMVVFALFEALPRLRKIEFSADKIYWGGFLSGFFGGLSGHQGALRSVFLIRAGLTKETFISTGIAIACIVDFVRLAFYRPQNLHLVWSDHGLLLGGAVVAAAAGAFIGNLVLKKTEMRMIQVFVAGAVSLIGICVAAGII